MSKPKTYRDYDPRRIELAESALLTIWECLGDLHQHLVLVGGLVPKYLCGDVKGPSELPRPATMDVDIGIAVSADEGHGEAFSESSPSRDSSGLTILIPAASWRPSTASRFSSTSSPRIPLARSSEPFPDLFPPLRITTFPSPVPSSYSPHHTITPAILSLVAEIAGEVGRLGALSGTAHVPKLRRENRIRSIHASLAIKNNTLSLDQVTAVISGKRVLGLPREIQGRKTPSPPTRPCLRGNPPP